MCDGVFLQVGLLQFLRRCLEHCLGGYESDVLQLIDYPAVDFICKFIKINILLVIFYIAINIDCLACKGRSKLDIKALLADCEAHLLGVQKYFCLPGLFVELDGIDLCGRKCSLYIEFRI